MRLVTLEAYKILYYITGAKKFAYLVTITLVTIFNIIYLKGLSTLLTGVVPMIEYVALIAKFPFVLGLFPLMFLFSIKVTPFDMVGIANQIQTKFFGLLVYLSVGGLLLGYSIFIK